MDGRGAYLHLDKHQRGQGCKETCATNAFNELHLLKLTPQFPGGAEAFVNLWDDTISKLEELDNGTNQIKPTVWTERTMFKNAIVDPEYKNVLANLTMMSPPPSLEKCKSEIRKHGSKIDKEKKARAHYTSAWSGPYSPYESDEDITEEELCTIAAVV